MSDLSWFTSLRYGLFVHFGLYSLLGRGEWVMNREAIPPEEYAKLAEQFNADHFDADAICDLAVRGGMRYVVLTTMHHEGFRLYETSLSDYHAVNTPAKRDLVAEMIEAARKRDLKIGLYHSLNNWFDQPDAVAALENTKAYGDFIDATFARIEELVRRFNPIDILWYDGWWPFDARDWQAERMNQMVRSIQPHVIFNGRNGLPGDFATPEQHLAAPSPWRPWEACITTNDSWGFHAGDHEWKTPKQIATLLATAAQGRGNLLLNIGLAGDGSIPKPAAESIEAVGRWIQENDNCIYDTDMWTFDPYARGDHRGDWCHHGQILRKGRSLYLLIHRWAGSELFVAGLEARVCNAQLLNPRADLAVHQNSRGIQLSGLPKQYPKGETVCPVIRIDCNDIPAMYLTGGMRTPSVPHPHYDPCPSDIIAGGQPG